MKPSDVREYTSEELRERLSEMKEERFKLKFQAGMMEIENPSLLRTLRKDIARIKTVLNERDSDDNPEEA